MYTTPGANCLIQISFAGIYNAVIGIHHFYRAALKIKAEGEEFWFITVFKDTLDCAET